MNDAIVIDMATLGGVVIKINEIPEFIEYDDKQLSARYERYASTESNVPRMGQWGFE